MTTFLKLETADFADASRSMYTGVADPVVDAVFALTAALSDTGAMAGSDPGGQAWAADYDRAADAAIRVGIDLANGCYHLSALFAQSARNYEAADAASSPGPAHAPYLAVPDPTRVGTGAYPPTAAGGSSPLPFGWSVVAHQIGRVWPDGHQDRLRAAAAAWDTAADRLRACAWQPQLAALDFVVDRLPEGTDMLTVCRAAAAHVEAVAGAYAGLAGACRDLAHHIDTVHSTIEHELVSLGWQTAAIEGIGAAISVFTFGAAQAPTQAVEFARIAAVAARIRASIDAFVVGVRAAAALAAAQSARFDAVLAELRAMFGLPVTAVAVTSAGRLPAVGRLSEQLAVTRISAEPGPLRALVMQRRRMDAARSAESAGGLAQARASWANPSKLLKHFVNHGYQFAARTQEEYSEMAAAFLQRAGTSRLPSKVEGDIVRVYEPSTNTFGSYTRDGRIITFFKPGRGISYWNDQPGKSVQW